MKRSVLTFLSAIFFMTFVFAEQITKNSFVFDVNYESATVVQYLGSDEKVAIPSTINKVPVTKIGKGAFKGNKSIKTVSLGQNMIEIGDEAFAGCENLQTVYVRNISESHVFGKDCFTDSENVKVRFVPAQLKVVQKAGAPKRKNMVYVEGKGTVKSFYMDKYEENFEDYLKLMEYSEKINDKSLTAYDQILNIIIFCNKLSIQEGRTPCYSFAGTTDYEKWNMKHYRNRTTEWTDETGMIKRQEGLKCDFTADGYRLPTLEEWIYAARGGKNPDNFKYSGSNDLDEVAINSHNSVRFQPSGRLKPNKLGIYDMSGNVAEICFYRFDGQTPEFVYCGGHQEQQEVYMRIDGTPTIVGLGLSYTSRAIGFRLVCTAD